MQKGLAHMDTVTQIQLPHGHITTIDEIDSDLSALSVTVRKPPTSGPYAFVNMKVDGKYRAISIHTIILERMLGRKLEKGELVDHIDLNPLNNRRSNLRLANKRKNATNSKKRSDNKSGYKGVCWSKPAKRWRAYGKRDGKQIHLGYFDTPTEAHNAYRNFAAIEYGEYARYE